MVVNEETIYKLLGQVVNRCFNNSDFIGCLADLGFRQNNADG